MATSAITASRMGRTAWIPSVVRPSMRLASRPIARTLPVRRSTATTEGSLSTIPWPFTWMSVLAVPRSTAISGTGRGAPVVRTEKAAQNLPVVNDDECNARVRWGIGAPPRLTPGRGGLSVAGDPPSPGWPEPRMFTHHEPDGIRVSAEPFFLAEQSDPEEPRFVFAYR